MTSQAGTRTARHIMVAVWLLGCSGPQTGTPPQTEARKCSGVLPPLPEPVVWKVPPPAQTPEQRQRQQEADQYVARRYCEQGYRIVRTTQAEVGDIIDWLDPASVAGSQEKPPPKPSPEEMKPPEGVELQTTELDIHPERRGPLDTIPMNRPTFAVYVAGHTGAISVEDWVRNHQVVSRAPSIEREPP